VSTTNKFPIISLRHIEKSYQLGTKKIDALNDISLDIYQGEFITIQGPSGCGKTTFLNLLGLIDDPSSGELIIGHQRVDNLTEDEKSAVRVRTPTIFQFYNLLEYFNATDNVGIALAAKGIKNAKERKKKAEEMLILVGLGHRLKNKPEELSGGERQRVAIARAMVVEPTIILADEPTGDLDTRTGNEILELFKQLNIKYGYTFLIVTHDPRIADMGTRKIKMQDYKIISDISNVKHENGSTTQ
jgi:putative ABC transport system ATP-binding protein